VTASTDFGLHRQRDRSGISLKALDQNQNSKYHMKTNHNTPTPSLLALIGVLGIAGNCHAAINIADWTFETSAPTTAGPFSPEIGSGSASGSHAGTTTYSSPAGNGSAHSFSSTAWAVGDYYQFQVSTHGNSGIALSWDQTSSNTGPRDYLLKYSTDGVNFTAFGSGYSVLANASPNTPWSSSGMPNTAYSFSQDLSSITALNNQDTVYFRLVDNSTTSANGGAVASAGTDRVDNFIVSAVPEPAHWGLGAAVGLLGLSFLQRKLVQV